MFEGIGAVYQILIALTSRNIISAKVSRLIKTEMLNTRSNRCAYHRMCLKVQCNLEVYEVIIHSWLCLCPGNIRVTLKL